MKYITPLTETLKKWYDKLTETKVTDQTPVEELITSVYGAGSSLISCEVTENDEGLVIESVKAVQLGVGCLVSTSIEIYRKSKQTVSVSSVFIPNTVIIEKGENEFGVMEYDVVDAKSVPKKVAPKKTEKVKEPEKVKVTKKK